MMTDNEAYLESSRYDLLRRLRSAGWNIPVPTSWQGAETLSSEGTKLNNTQIVIGKGRHKSITLQ